MRAGRGQEMPERRVSESPKRRRDAADTREAILEAATRRFATHSYEHAGVREIAADAGVTAALVNRYFGSKEKLFDEVIQRPSTSGTWSRTSGATWPTTSPGSWCTGGRTHRTGCIRRSCSCCIPPRSPAQSSCSGGTSTAPCFGSSPSRSAVTTRRSGPSWSWHSSRGSRSCTTSSAPRRSRTPVAKNWRRSCPGALPPVWAETTQGRLRSLSRDPPPSVGPALSGKAPKPPLPPRAYLAQLLWYSGIRGRKAPDVQHSCGLHPVVVCGSSRMMVGHGSRAAHAVLQPDVQLHVTACQTALGQLASRGRIRSMPWQRGRLSAESIKDGNTKTHASGW